MAPLEVTSIIQEGQTGPYLGDREMGASLHIYKPECVRVCVGAGV